MLRGSSALALPICDVIRLLRAATSIPVVSWAPAQPKPDWPNPPEPVPAIRPPSHLGAAPAGRTTVYCKRHDKRVAINTGAPTKDFKSNAAWSHRTACTICCGLMG